MDTQQPPVLLTDKSLLIQQQQRQQAKVGEEKNNQKSNLQHQLNDLLFGSVTEMICYLTSVRIHSFTYTHTHFFSLLVWSVNLQNILLIQSR